ncbi:AsnC family protein [Bacillus sp. FJAT-27231]|uniref:AsnC family protein n=1 Tax=Bacillus sp. FJAT-27231 TaxID=1679168 RepID=UPI000670ACCB|nr:AsnC family protein [Bacillus sp. FJAT-27231]
MLVGRNEPCPCGSGKKFKKCCGRIEGSAIHGVMQEELENLQRELIDYAMEHHSYEMKKHFQSFLHTYEVLRKDPQVYLIAFEIWFILTQPLKNGQTILQEFVAHRAQTVNRERTRTVFLTWPQVKFIAGTVKTARGNVYEVEDVLSGETVSIRARRQLPIEGVFVSGGLLPFEKEYTFFMIDFHFEQYVVPKATNWLSLQFKQSEEISSQQFLAANWLSVLEGLFSIYEEQNESEEKALDHSELTWEKESQKKTADALLAFLQEEGIGELRQQTAVLLWNLYCQKENPTIRKPEIYTAAVYSLLQSHQMIDTDYSNSQLASRLGVSAASLAKRVKEMEQVLEGHLQQDKQALQV